MKPFLQHIIDDLKPAGPGQLRDMCFVFPTRRAGVYFRDLLRQAWPHTVYWEPAVLSIEEFVELHGANGAVVVDELRLLVTLFTIYRELDPDYDDFTTFYAWGQTLLNDFDELDRHLIEAGKLYANLRELAEVEAAFEPSEEQQQALRAFQEMIGESVKEKSSLYQDFAAMWQTVGQVYGRLQEVLRANGWAYTGMCYRQLATALLEEGGRLPYSRVVFAGFNAMARAEEVIIDSLLQAGKAQVYFDADAYYLHDDNQEAGTFLRRWHKKWRNHPQVHWVVTRGFETAKEIEIVGVSQQVAMARAAAALAAGEGRPALVLADEQLLLPLLYALPHTDEALNITMGYPLSATATGMLLRAAIRYQAACRTTASGDHLVEVAALAALIGQPALATLDSQCLEELTRVTTRFLSWSRIEEKLLYYQEEARNTWLVLLQPGRDTSGWLTDMARLLADLYHMRKEQAQPATLLEAPVTATAVRFLQQLQATLATLPGRKPDMKMLEKVMSETLRQLKVPFAGEPLAPRQVMGFLETRALDFEEIALLAVNEDILPAARSHKTFIPFGIRKAFGLPTFLEHNAIYAYHFFRLLQRAARITIFYNTQLSVLGRGEQSRFIQQLVHRLGADKSSVKLRQKLLVPDTPAIANAMDITIEKNEQVQQQLTTFLDKFTSEKPLSPTTLIDYINCPLQFYYARVLGIREPDETGPEIDQRVLGNLLHRLLEEAYKPWLGKTVEKAAIDRLLKSELSVLLEKVFGDYDHNDPAVEFNKRVVNHLARQMLAHDKQAAPFEILDLESVRQQPLHEINLPDGRTIPVGGKIDRLDRLTQAGLVRIIDYKTGKADLPVAKGLPEEDEIRQYFTDINYKSGFQLYYYAWIYHRQHPDEPLTAGIYGVHQLSAGLAYLRQTAGPLPASLLDEFEKQLQQMLCELLDPAVPFVQTDEEKRCSYCTYKTICSR